MKINEHLKKINEKQRKSMEVHEHHKKSTEINAKSKLQLLAIHARATRRYALAHWDPPGRVPRTHRRVEPVVSSRPAGDVNEGA